MPQTNAYHIRQFPDAASPLAPGRGAFQNYRLPPPPTHARCEAVAAERAGGERGFLFAAQKTENRVPPSIKAASSTVAATLRRPLNAGRANVKKQYKRLSFSPTPKKGCGEKRRGFSPRRARSASWGAGRGMVGIDHAVKPCIKTPVRATYSCASLAKAPVRATALVCEQPPLSRFRQRHYARLPLCASSPRYPGFDHVGFVTG